MLDSGVAGYYCEEEIALRRACAIAETHVISARDGFFRGFHKSSLGPAGVQPVLPTGQHGTLYYMESGYNTMFRIQGAKKTSRQQARSTLADSAPEG